MSESSPRGCTALSLVYIDHAITDCNWLMSFTDAGDWCRRQFALALRVLLAVCEVIDLSSCKKLRQQVIDDANAAAQWLTVHRSPSDCNLLRALCTSLQNALPVKASQRVDQVVTRAVIATKRLTDREDTLESAASGEPCSRPTGLEGLPDESLQNVLALLPAADLAALCCTCRCVSAHS